MQLQWTTLTVKLLERLKILKLYNRLIGKKFCIRYNRLQKSPPKIKWHYLNYRLIINHRLPWIRVKIYSVYWNNMGAEGRQSAYNRMDKGLKKPRTNIIYSITLKDTFSAMFVLTKRFKHSHKFSDSSIRVEFASKNRAFQVCVRYH